jgi:hypothetical protein
MMCEIDPRSSSANQIQGMFKVILDPENMLAALNKSEKTDFLTYFYKHSMHVLTGTTRKVFGLRVQRLSHVVPASIL